MEIPPTGASCLIDRQQGRLEFASELDRHVLYGREQMPRAGRAPGHLYTDGYCVKPGVGRGRCSQVYECAWVMLQSNGVQQTPKARSVARASVADCKSKIRGTFGVALGRYCVR